jgi:DNA-binding MurR/RpiR family transcriptional regulator
MKNVLHLITNKYLSMSVSEKKIANYILKNPEEVILLSMRALAEKTELSDNTVLRFCRTCGFSGYLDFKTALMPLIVIQKGSIYRQVDTHDPFAIQKNKIAENITAAIKETYEMTEEKNIDTIAKKITQSSHVYVVGLAGSFGVSQVFTDSLLALGVPSSSLADRVEIERTCLNLTGSSVLIGFSHHGETDEVLMAVRRAGENGAFTVLVSNNITAAQEAAADIYLLTQVPAVSISGAYFALPRIVQLSLVELILSKIASFLTIRKDTRQGDTSGQKEVTMG